MDKESSGETGDFFIPILSIIRDCDEVPGSLHQIEPVKNPDIKIICYF